MYFVPLGLLLSDNADVVRAADVPASQLSGLDASGLITNIAGATIGNVVGGAVLVGLVYWFVYLRPVRGSS
jgi:formate/nitrite transporter FocA (FNT family)